METNRIKMVKKSNIYSLENKSFSNAYIELACNTPLLDCMRASSQIYKKLERNVDILVHALTTPNLPKQTEN